jgi:hypothetical protein
LEIKRKPQIDARKNARGVEEGSPWTAGSDGIKPMERAALARA